MWWVCGVLPLLATLWSYAAIRASLRNSDSFLQEDMDIPCPENCGDVFRRLDDHGVQTTRVQIRGEPKSGTGTSEEWAAAALHATCEYLKRLYGDDSCSINTDEFRYYTEMVFEPGLASASSAACSCTGAKRATVSVSGEEKHLLPVRQGCGYWHISNIANSSEGMCQYEDGRPLENQVDLWRCVQEAGCTMNNDDALQLVVMRDPVPMTVSTYFHLKRARHNHVTDNLTLDQFFHKFFELFCKWVSLRYYFFTQFLADESEVFWYGDHEADPLDWHLRYLVFIGLNLPLDVTMAMARMASEGDLSSVLSYKVKGLDEHPGTNSTVAPELGEDSLQFASEVLRTWMPPVLLKRIGVPLP